MRRRSRPISLLALVGLVATACTAADDPVIETATVDRGEVVQTVAAPARLEPAARATVTATISGRVEELLVDDGDEVAAGDPLVRLTSASLDEQIEQAEAAVAAAEEAGAAASAAGIDVSPALGALRGQLDGVFPPLLGALESQVTAAEAGLEAAAAAVSQTETAAQQLTDTLLAGLDDDELADLGELIDLDSLPDSTAAGADATAMLDEARRAAADARNQLATTRRSVSSASAELAAAEAELAGQADAAGAAQAAVVEAQIEQAERALAATQDRLDELVVTAPIGGVVELVRGASGGGELGGELGDLGSLGDLGGLGDGAVPGDLLGGGGNGSTVTGPISVGREISVGQELVRVYDLSSFHAEVEVDEIDVVEVEAGQPVALAVDAFPAAELVGRVEHVAMAPTRGAVGGALYPVSVELTEVPEDIRLRTGLTASAEIEVRRIDGDLVVPTSALLRRGGGEVVFVVREGIAREIPVQVLAIGDQDAAIDGDLERGEEVVTIGVELIEDGDELP